MKEIRKTLFKGYSDEYKKWVQGDLVTNGIDYETAIRINDKNSSEYGQIIRVNPNTVCEFAGFCDNNGKEVFEYDTVQFKCATRISQNGDIIEGESKVTDDTRIVQFVKGEFTPRPCVRISDDYWYSFKLYDFYVIGSALEFKPYKSSGGLINLDV